jgi:hypothetical protein
LLEIRLHFGALLDKIVCEPLVMPLFDGFGEIADLVAQVALGDVVQYEQNFVLNVFVGVLVQLWAEWGIDVEAAELGYGRLLVESIIDTVTVCQSHTVVTIAVNFADLLTYNFFSLSKNLSSLEPRDNEELIAVVGPLVQSVREVYESLEAELVHTVLGSIFLNSF